MSILPILIIGYGNTLRSDDGVGYRIAEQIAEWNLPNVRSLPLHQLTPELAAELAQVKIAIFVDAQTLETSPLLPQLMPLTTDEAAKIDAHCIDPRSLLTLTHSLYGATPTTYQILIPTINFSFGETLSPQAQAGMHEAIALLKNLLTDAVQELA